jgi:hypothetical protein
VAEERGARVVACIDGVPELRALCGVEHPVRDTLPVLDAPCPLQIDSDVGGPAQSE